MVGGRMCRLVWWPNFRLPFCRQLVIESPAMRWFLIIALSTSAWAQTAPFAPPEDISFRRANIISEGTRMSAEGFARQKAVYHFDGARLGRNGRAAAAGCHRLRARRLSGGHLRLPGLGRQRFARDPDSAGTARAPQWTVHRRSPGGARGGGSDGRGHRLV